MRTPKPRPSGLVALLLLAACRYKSPEDCESISNSMRASDCWTQTVMAEFVKDRASGEAWAEKIPDSVTRDYVWHQATIKVNKSDLRYCQRIENELLRKECENFVRRPHMHREVGAQTDGEGAEGQAPPPGPRTGGPGGPGGPRGPGGPGAQRGPGKAPAPPQ